MLRPIYIFVASLLASACTTSEPGEDMDMGVVTPEEPTWRTLIDHTQWQVQNADADPEADHRPSSVECMGGWYEELGGLEVDTSLCNYLSLEQPLMADLEQGDPVRLRMWWASLASVDPAEGHIAVFIDGMPLWEERVAIPGPAEARSLEFESPISAPAGATLTLHLHNHGYNTWNFHELTALGSDT